MPDFYKTIYIDLNHYDEKSIAILKALSSEWRLKILKLVGSEPSSVNQIAQILDIPLSTAAMHIKELEDAELIHTTLRPAVRGQQKICDRRFENILLTLPPLEKMGQKYVEISIPIGSYTSYSVLPTCGMASENGLIGMLDDPISFLEPDRFQAQLLWFRRGFIEYQVPYRFPPNVKLSDLSVLMEVCSEAPTHNENWPSDITLWINGLEIGTWTSPGDYGGTRGALTPSWWVDNDTQWGLLKKWHVNGTGSYIDSLSLSEVTLADLKIEASPVLNIRLGIKPETTNIGGINLFGQKFGNYPQDLCVRINYEEL
jgi:predicted transcriptional regulator